MTTSTKIEFLPKLDTTKRPDWLGEYHCDNGHYSEYVLLRIEQCVEWISELEDVLSDRNRKLMQLAKARIEDKERINERSN